MKSKVSAVIFKGEEYVDLYSKVHSTVKDEDYADLCKNSYDFACEENKKDGKVCLESFAKGSFKTSLKIACNILTHYHQLDEAGLKTMTWLVTDLTRNEINKLYDSVKMFISRTSSRNTGNS